MKKGMVGVEELNKFIDVGKLPSEVHLSIDAESVYKSLISKELETPAEKTLLGHVMWIREELHNSIVKKIQWCNTRNMIADGHTKGSVDREILINLMNGLQTFKYPVKSYEPHREKTN